MQSPPCLHLVDKDDDVGAALRNLAQGETVDSVLARAPVPRGHISGGIATPEEKSLGAVKMSGRSARRQVLDYGERVDLAPASLGLARLEAPGNDAVSSTALSAGGATLIVFTTGGCTPLGLPVPTQKIATLSNLAQGKPGWIDFDAGRLLSEEREVVSADLLDLIVDTASERQTGSKINEEREIAIWKTDVTR